jgi:hypothetical protein
MNMSDSLEKVLKMQQERQERINKIAEAVKSNSIEPKTAEKILPNGTKQMVTKALDFSGKEVYTVSNDDKNFMSFTTKKQLMDFLKD